MASAGSGRTDEPASAEARRLAEAGAEPPVPWRRWGPYLSERAWGTVREDYSPDGAAWTWFPHEHARSRTYRWNEDGMAGICDDRQFLCLSLSLWNGADPIMKERMFGLTGPEGNHAEDAKDYWFYLDSTPTHSWMRWRYLYPQAPFPYEDLRAENRRRTRADPEYELVDTGAFDGGYWEVTLEVAKAGPEDLCLAVRAVNVGDRPAELHLVPTLWLRNTWGWGRDTRKAVLSAVGGNVHVDGHSWLGPRMLAGDGDPVLLFCDNESNRVRIWGAPAEESPPFPKDGIHDHVVHGTPTVNPARTGTKAALWYRRRVGPGEATELRLRLAPRGDQSAADLLGAGWERVMATRAAEADAWCAELAARAPGGLSSEEAMVLRQAAAGMLWGKQFYHYDVDHWLEGDPPFPPPPRQRAAIRNDAWRHLSNADVISMPDTWEYPWYASWDLALQCIALAHLDPAFAKSQLLMLCREWFMHPNGQTPAYEWDFGDANPPVLAYAAMAVWLIDGSRDYDFLERMLHKLSINFTWWVNRKDPGGTNVFAGGFLGLDNIAPFDRSILPEGYRLDQADGTGWMAFYALSLLALALTLAAHDATYEDLATKFFEHFTYIAVALDQRGLWDEEDGFFYDLLHNPDGSTERIRVRSMVGLIPLFAVGILEADVLERLPAFRARMEWFELHRPRYRVVCRHADLPGHHERRLLSIVTPERLRRILTRLLDESEFLSPYGIRALSRHHRDNPVTVTVGGMRAQVDYEPGESRTPLFGGNSNWRGPVWFPVNHLMIRTLLRFHDYCGPG
ncbi:MAG TPA: glucosidase, partial [Actinomycetota bacterium]|nr:glucosidase [Actinomycetota bacterium]